VWNQRPIADYLHSSLSQVTRSTSIESDSDVTSSQSSVLDDDEEEDEVDDDDEQEEENEDEDEDTEGSRTVEIADEEDGDHDGTHLASVDSTTSPLRTQPSPHSPIGGDDRDLGHVGPTEDVDIAIHIGISNANTNVSPSLGYLDEALSFIAAERERARWSAFNGAGVSPGGLSLGIREEGEWMHVIGMCFLFFAIFAAGVWIQKLKYAELNRAPDPPEEA